MTWKNWLQTTDNLQSCFLFVVCLFHSVMVDHCLSSHGIHIQDRGVAPWNGFFLAWKMQQYIAILPDLSISHLPLHR